MDRLAGKNGFTLVELSVVIAIIAILAALPLPALAMTKEKAKATQCMNHLKELGLVVMMYADDNGSYPVAVVGPDTPIRMFGSNIIFEHTSLFKLTLNLRSQL